MKSLHIIEKPSSKQAKKFIEKNHKKNPEKTMLLISGKCMVDYQGRARSLLDWGERLIMIKEDGTLIVHQPTMREPVNWQSAGSITEFKTKDEKLILKSRINKPPEKMKVVFEKIQFITITQLKDNAKLVVSGMEEDVVNGIVSNPEMVEEGLRISKREKHVKSGLIDLYGFDKNHTPVIIEVKRSLANISAVHQLRMYVNDVKAENEEANVRGILCAPKIPDMVKHLLSDYDLEWKEVERKIIIPDDWQKTLKDF